MTQFKSYVDTLKNIYEIPHKWNEDYTEITFYKTNDNGFDISIGDDIQEKTIYIYTNLGLHSHYHYEGEGYSIYEETLEESFGYVRDMLSNHARIRELSKNNKPYKWILEFYTEGTWHSEEITGLLIFNWFGKKSEKYYINNTLPPREL